MTSAAQGAILSAALLAIAGAFFGVCMARMLWAHDLKHTQDLRRIWDRTELAMRGTIELQQRQIETLKSRK